MSMSSIDLIKIRSGLPRLYVGYVDLVTTAILALTAFLWAVNHGPLQKKDPLFDLWFQRPQESAGPAGSSVTSNVARCMEESGAHLVIFWGSQSGTAEGLAHRLARELRHKLDLQSLVADLSDYEPSSIAEIRASKPAVFLLSTYGEGDPSDNATQFWAWLEQAADELLDLRYCALGLGNSNYQHYNKVVDVVTARLNKLGATSIMSVARADDAIVNATEETYLDWRDELQDILATMLGRVSQQRAYEPSLKVVLDESMGLHGLSLGEPVYRPTAKSRTSASEIVSIPVAHSYASGSSSKPCVHMELDIHDHPRLKYRSGDHLAVWPVNESTQVSQLLDLLGLWEHRNKPVLLSANTSSQPLDALLPNATTLNALFQNYLDIAAPVSRDTVQHLVDFALTSSTQNFLRGLTSRDSWHDFVGANHVTFSRFLELANRADSSHNWHHLPLSFVVESLRPLIPRRYSISSSAVVSPRKLSITVAVAAMPLFSNAEYNILGLCSNYLNNLEITSTTRIHASIQRSTFKLPVSANTPLVLVGAGTGIAPLRAFIHERAALARAKGREVGEIILFYGCRNDGADFLYKQEVEDLASNDLKGRLEIVTAFSRQKTDGKTYVQDRMSEEVWARRLTELLVEQNGAVYFCGSTFMAKSAGDALVQAVSVYADKRLVPNAVLWKEERKRMGRWKEDVWG